MPTTRKQLRAHRLRTANSELEALRTELAFEQMSIELSDGGLHWKFLFGAKHIADYWPASGKGQLVGQDKALPCSSVSQAQRLAITAKRQILASVAKAMQP